MTTHQSIAPAYVRLKENKKIIFEQWVLRALREVKAAYQHDDPILINSLPTFLDRLVDALDPAVDNTNASVGNSLSFEHGIQRANVGFYTLDQVITEYGILQDVILDLLNEEEAVTARDCSIIARSFLGATRDAASAFVKAMAEKHAESELQFKSLVEDAKDIAIFIVSPEGIIKTWNEGATRIKQFSSDEVIGHHFRMLYRIEDQKAGRPEHNLKKALENGRHEEQWWRIKKDGSWWWAEAILSSFYSPSGKLLGVAKIVRDLTEKKKTDDALKEAKVHAEMATQLKSTFVANMSHEIRTPLNAILGFSKLMADSEASQLERDDWAQVIERNGSVLLRLIDDILDMSKIEAGKLDIDNVHIHVRTALPEVIALFEIKAKEKGITLTLDMHPCTPEHITTDAVRLRQIFSNLLSNAVKFTERGAVQVMVTGHKKDERISGLEIVVSDSGPGIAKDKISRIFGEFNQEDSSVTRKHGGTGLGLALSRKLARELGGDLELVDCTANLGCTFKAVIADQPRASDQDAISRQQEIASWKLAQKEKATFPNLKGSRILVVDDSRDNQVLAKVLLSKAGAEVVLANNGIEGVEKAMAGNFDVVIMDTQMPLMDGNEATAQLREKGYDKPIVSLTAHAMIEDRQKALKAGSDDYISKPIDPKQLLNTLEKWSTQVRQMPLRNH